MISGLCELNVMGRHKLPGELQTYGNRCVALHSNRKEAASVCGSTKATGVPIATSSVFTRTICLNCAK